VDIRVFGLSIRRFVAMIYDIIAWIIVVSAFGYVVRRLIKVVSLFKKDVNPCSMCGNSACQLKSLKGKNLSYIGTDKI